MPMYDKDKRPVHFPFVFHDVLREIEAAANGPKGFGDRARDFPVLRLMNEDDYEPRPESLEDVKTFHLMKEVRRWNAFKAAIRRDEGFWARGLIEEFKLTPKLERCSEHGREGYRFIIRASRKHDWLTGIAAITYGEPAKKC